MKAYKNTHGVILRLISITGMLQLCISISAPVKMVLKFSDSIFQPNIESMWLLFTAFWNDNGIWMDDQSWKDEL